MGRYARVIKFHALTWLKWQTVSITAVLAFNVLLSVLVPAFTSISDPHVTIGSTDIVALVWVLAIGAILTPYGFRFLLYHGVSRSTQFTAMCLTLAALSAAWALIVMAFISANLVFARTSVLYQLLYSRADVLGTITWEFAAFLLLAFVGWFTYLVLRVTGRNAKIALIAAPFMLGPILGLLNMATDGALLRAVGRAVVAAMGLSSSVPNPYVGVLSMLVLTLAFGAAIRPILLRVQVRES
jgi:hypothetical protein